MERFKSQFHRSADLLHFNHAGQSLLSRPALEKLRLCEEAYFTDAAFSWLKLHPELEAAKKELAGFLGAKTTEIAYFQTTAAALSQVALGYRLKAGDEIIVWDQEYPSNHYPWALAAKRAGAKLVVVSSGQDLSTPVESIERAITPRTKIIATSWVQYRSGARIDLQPLTTLARARGIFTCADIIQGAGVIPFDFQASGLDAAAGGGHKWMMSGHGVGYLLLREDRLEDLEPLMVGAMTYGTPDDAVDVLRPWKADATRFEPGGKAFSVVMALGASAKLLRETGIQNVEREAERLTRQLQEGLEARGYVVASPHGEKFRGAILNFVSGPGAKLRELAEIEKTFVTAKVAYAKRPPGIRLSLHAMMQDEDVARVLALL